MLQHGIGTHLLLGAAWLATMQSAVGNKLTVQILTACLLCQFLHPQGHHVAPPIGIAAWKVYIPCTCIQQHTAISWAITGQCHTRQYPAIIKGRQAAGISHHRGAAGQPW
jgi:hypothetical protein